MKRNGECESGYVGDAELIGIPSSTFTNIQVIRRSAMSITASAERFGHKWMLKALPDSDNSTLARQRLLKEFEIMTRLRHPGIVDAISIEEVDGLGLSIVMEWVEGTTLDEILNENRLSKKERHHLAVAILDASAFMHSMGIVHRDLKPSNIMVRKSGGVPVIIDFGLADTDSHTMLKQPAGTEGYIPPEAYSRHDADTRDDVYSLGIILQRMHIGLHSIIRKCLAPAEKRYPGADKLKVAVLKHESRKKFIIRIVAIAVVVASFAALVAELTSMREQRTSDSATMATMQDSITHLTSKTAVSAQAISNLKDSLEVMRTSVENAVAKQSIVDAHNAELRRVVRNGVAIEEAIFAQFDHDAVARLRSEGLKVSEISNLLVTTMANSLNQYLEGLKSSLPPEDFATVYKEIWEREVQLCDDWQKNVLNGKGDD